jgi:predicted ATP-binding protein involved in virulence
MDYNYLNEPTKVLVRQLLVAKAKETIGNIRGTFSGKVHIPQAELQMDYQMLINQGQQEYQKVMENLEKRLERLNPAAVLENQAKIIQQNLEIQKATPLGIFVI